MELRIKEVCKEKGMTLAEVAKQIRWKDKENVEHIGINPVTLSQSLNGNPTLARLSEVADILGVEVSDFFVRSSPMKDEVFGCLYVNGKPRIVNNVDEIKSLLLEVESKY